MGIRLLKLVQNLAEIQMSPLSLSIFVPALLECYNIIVTPRRELVKEVFFYLKEELQYLANAAELEGQLHGNGVSQSLRKLKAFCTITAWGNIFMIGSYFFPRRQIS